MRLSWKFVATWTQKPNQDCTVETRGWKKGVPRKFSTEIIKRISRIRKELEQNPDEFYIGDIAIRQAYGDRYPDEPVPGIDYINKVLRNEKLSRPHKKRQRGTAKYLCYPIRCIKRLGERIAEIDFIGQKYIQGHVDPLHFLSVAYQTPRRLRKITRTESQLTEEAIKATEATFEELGWPEVVRLDSGTPFIGRGDRADEKGARSIPRYAVFLLRNQVIPIFGAIRSPWNQAHVEGTNSVFGKNFWNQCEFTSTREVDERLIAFNRCSKKRAEWKAWKKNLSQHRFVPHICFIRKVGEDAKNKQGVIPVAGTFIQLPKVYIGLFVFTEWNLKKEILSIYFERDENIQCIKQLRFQIHPRSRERCLTFIL